MPARPPRQWILLRGLTREAAHWGAFAEGFAQSVPSDAVLALEIVEHVADPAAFLATCAGLARPGGVVVVSTLNRTAKSFALGIVGAEWVMRWLPRGTHDWRRFITPAELDAMLAQAGLTPCDHRGMVFDPLGWSWSLSARDLGCNYLATATR